MNLLVFLLSSNTPRGAPDVKLTAASCRGQRSEAPGFGSAESLEDCRLGEDCRHDVYENVQMYLLAESIDRCKVVTSCVCVRLLESLLTYTVDETGFAASFSAAYWVVSPFGLLP